MTFSYLGPDPLDVQIETALTRLAAGEPPSQIETTQVDFKEEPGRRRRGTVVPGGPQSDEAARYFAGELACLANTPGGGALIVGVADDGQRIGTELDKDWLRHRIYELTSHQLLVTAQVVEIDQTRLLVLRATESAQAVKWDSKYKWRVNDHCVDVDLTSWTNERFQRVGIDWSSMPSGHTLDDVSPTAVEIARNYLTEAGENSTIDLAKATTPDLLRRMNLVDGGGRLNNAGSLLFVETPHEGIDYMHRDVAGGDSTARVRGTGPLIVQFDEVIKATRRANRTIHVTLDGVVHGQHRAIPDRAAREAIVNGIVHRDWHSAQPTVVEHIGDRLVISSPGGFVGGVTPRNIVTHPAAARYRTLADAMANLRIAEREGIGVDRMVGDMLATGRPAPVIEEIDGPYVRVALVGGDPDERMMQFLAKIHGDTTGDINALLLIDHLCRHGWIDSDRAANLLQRAANEADEALDRLSRALISGRPVIVPVKGVRVGQPPAWRFSDAAREELGHRAGKLNTPGERDAQIIRWAVARGRVSTTEIADLVGVTGTTANTISKNLEKLDLLAAGRENKAGRGFFYVPTDSAIALAQRSTP